MIIEISVPEVINLIKEIQPNPAKIFEMAVKCTKNRVKRCYRRSAFISLMMVLDWKANAEGKARPNLPSY